MSDVDVGAEMTKVARALNRVKTNGAAHEAAAAALDHADALALTAGDLPDLFRGAAAGSAIKRRIEADATTIRGKSDAFDAESLAAAPVNPGPWEALRRAIERVYIDGGDVYAASDLDVSAFRALIGNLDQRIVEYGKRLENAGLAAPGVLLGDAVATVGTNVGKVGEGTAEGLAAAGKGVTSAVFSGLLKGLWPVLLLGGVVVVGYYLAPALLSRTARRIAAS